MLTRKQIEDAKPKAKPYKIFDGGSPALYLEISPKGMKTWRVRVREMRGKKQATRVITLKPHYPALSI